MDIKSILKFLLKSLVVVLGFVAFYLLMAYSLPYIEIPENNNGQKEEIPIYIYTNGVHTDLVVPVKNDIKDWSQEIPFENTRSKKTDFDYLGIGWGDKGFYLDTPTWAELKFSTAFKAAFWLGESAMHCTYYESMTESSECKKIMLSREEYKDLIHYIDAKFDRDSQGMPILIPTKAVYGQNDAFYDAQGRYSFLNTCNTWTNNGLKAAGQKAALWTAFDFGIFQHYN